MRNDFIFYVKYFLLSFLLVCTMCGGQEENVIFGMCEKTAGKG